MRLRLQSAFACLVVLLTAIGLTAETPASPRDSKTLVLRGRVTDAEGWPVAGARVVARGTRRARVSVDDAGQFAIDFPFGSLASLARNPVSVSLRAEQSGWQLALPGGEADLGFQLRVVEGEHGVARCEVRSNDPNVGAAIVRALGAEGDATGVAIVSFLGVRGQPIAGAATLELPVVALVPLSGVDAPAAPPSPVEVNEPVMFGKEKKTKGGGHQTVENSGTKPAKKGKQKPEPTADMIVESKLEPAPETKPDLKAEQKAARKAAEQAEKAAKKSRSTSKPERVDPPMKLFPPVPSPSPAPASPGEAEAKQRAERERAVARDEARRQREESQKHDRIERRGGDQEKPRILDDGTDSRATQEAVKLTRDAQDRRWESQKHDVPTSGGSADTTTAPPGRALVGVAGAPPRLEPREKQVVVPKLPVRRDTVAVLPPQLLPEPPPPSPWARVPVSSPGGTAPTGTSNIFPRPEGEPRTRAIPLVIRAPSLRPEKPDTAVASIDSCACRIQGTIEVDSERPLPARTRVAISLVWYPAIADTVELYMGSPRAFELPVAPCGPQRLRLVNLGALRFDVTSREAMAGFRCEGGPPRQFRVILQPR